MAYVEDANYASAPGQGNVNATGASSGGMNVTHGILFVFLGFLVLYMMFAYGPFRRINNAL